jgi:hypothetical protein
MWKLLEELCCSSCNTRISLVVLEDLYTVGLRLSRSGNCIYRVALENRTDIFHVVFCIFSTQLRDMVRETY